MKKLKPAKSATYLKYEAHFPHTGGNINFSTFFTRLQKNKGKLVTHEKRFYSFISGSYSISINS